jgi:hypothetical protein
MKHTILFMSCIVLVTALTTSCDSKKQDNVIVLENYKPIDIVLQRKIEELDSIEQQAALISEDIEFFHDTGGLSTSKTDIIEALKTNICGKVTRKLIKGSIEVYPINNYGVVQMGYHKFYNNQEPDAISNPSKFVTIWKKDNEDWKMTRIISLH